LKGIEDFNLEHCFEAEQVSYGLLRPNGRQALLVVLLQGFCKESEKELTQPM
jgi:hypothetical protein